MRDEREGRLRALAEEYCQLVEQMRSGQYDGDGYRALSSQRTVVHDELIALTGRTDRSKLNSTNQSLHFTRKEMETCESPAEDVSEPGFVW